MIANYNVAKSHDYHTAVVTFYYTKLIQGLPSLTTILSSS
jgi:hypothetical protein